MCMEKFNPASRSGRIGTSKISNRYRAEDSPSRSFTDYVAPLPLIMFCQFLECIFKTFDEKS